MVTRAHVLELLDRGHSYETAARTLKISPGLVFMIATGLPADGSDAPPPEELAAKRVLLTSTQHLVNPAAFNPAGKESVIAWVRERAHRELEQPTR
jgi:hypothetical protein